MYMSDDECTGISKVLGKIDSCQIKNEDLVFSKNELYILRNLLSRIKLTLDAKPRVIKKAY